MLWTADLERLCALDEHPAIHDPATQLFLGISVRYVLESLIPKIEDQWPEETRQAFKVAAVTAALGVVAAEQFTAAIVLTHLALETALRQRFEADHTEGIPLTLRDGSVIRCPDVTAFSLNRRQFKGVLAGATWFAGSYSDLRRWCFERGYLTAERAEQAKWTAYGRNDLVHSSTETRLPPGIALRVIDVHLGIAAELWASP